MITYKSGCTGGIAGGSYKLTLDTCISEVTINKLTENCVYEDYVCVKSYGGEKTITSCILINSVV